MPKKLDPKVAEKVMLKAGLKPLQPYKSSYNKWKCKCLVCGDIVKPAYKQIARGIGGCRTCRYRKSGKSNSIPEDKAIAIMLKNKIKPLEPYRNKDVPWKSICLVCDKNIAPTLGNLRKGQAGCKWCTRKFIDEKEAIQVMQKQGFKPLTKYKNDRTPWKCRCLKCGKIDYPTFAQTSRQKNITGCSNCNKHYMDPKKARAIFLKADLKPLEPYKNARTPWKSQCLNCKTVVSPMLVNVQKGKGCRACAPLGINLFIPSYLYLITHEELNSHKIGIGNIRPEKTAWADRLNKFKKEGWHTYKTWNFDTGDDAWKAEKAIFKIIRKDLQIPIHLTKEQMPKTEGQSETMNADTISLLELEKIIKKVMRDENYD
jgi:hypothetical protein